MKINPQKFEILSVFGTNADCVELWKIDYPSEVREIVVEDINYYGENVKKVFRIDFNIDNFWEAVADLEAFFITEKMPHDTIMVDAESNITLTVGDYLRNFIGWRLESALSK